MSKKLTLVVLTLALLCAAASTLSAATYTWDGSGTGSALNDWNNKANWTPKLNNHPDSADEALFTTVTAGRSTTPTVPATGSAINDILFGATAQVFTVAGTGTLTVNGSTGVGIVNNSANAQTFSVTGVTLGGSQSWSANGADLNFTGSTLNLAANTLTVDGANNITIDNAISGTVASGLIKDGTGTLILNGANTYSGTTTLNAGALSVGVAQTLGGAVNLGTGGTTGGTLIQANTGNSTFGALMVNGAPEILLAGSGSLRFASADWTAGTLTINNWSGTAGSSGLGAQIFITGTATANFLQNVTFAGAFPTGGELLGSGELVPVPEPQTYAAIFALGLLGFAIARRRMLANA